MYVNIIFIIDTLQIYYCNFLYLCILYIMPSIKKVKTLPNNIYNIIENIATIQKNLF